MEYKGHCNTKGIKNYKDLPKEAKEYVKEIEKQIQTRVSFVSTGQDRKEIIEIRSL